MYFLTVIALITCRTNKMLSYHPLEPDDKARNREVLRHEDASGVWQDWMKKYSPLA